MWQWHLMFHHKRKRIVCSAFFTLLEDHNLIGFQRPVGEQFHTAELNPLHHIFLPETSGFLARPSGGDFAAAQNSSEHALNVVIALRGVLSLDGTLHTIAHQKDAHMRAFTFCDVHRHAQGIIWAFIAIGSVIDDNR